jgi:hypothetical protein
MTKILTYKSDVDLDYPICRPSLDLDFTQEVLDNRITFTRGSTATRVNRNRLIESVAANQPRFDYDPVTGECKGLLIEESRQNLLTNSNTDVEFSNVARPNTWTSGQLAPDGSSTAKLCITNNRSFKEYITNSVNNVVSTFSIYLKTTGSIITRTFDLRDISSDTVRTTKTITITPNWQRFDITGTVQSNGIRVEITGGILNIFAWGAQLEAGAFPTSYIPTSASTVTRSAEIASMEGTNFSSWYNQTEGTFLFDGTLPFITNDTIIRVPFGVSNGFNFANSMYVSKSSTSLTLSFSIINDNVFQSTGTSLPNMTSSNFKIASSVSPRNIYSCGYGGIVNKHSRASAIIPTVNRLTLGREPWNSSPLNPIIGCVKRFTYYPKALKPNQLQLLTQ